MGVDIQNVVIHTDFAIHIKQVIIYINESYHATYLYGIRVFQFKSNIYY
jgi:hypothetical protein